ncbi:MAG: uracil phosphoribosyltransferase [bacterium]|nr:uracil phosphoribosyltransferase [bacterium]
MSQPHSIDQYELDRYLCILRDIDTNTVQFRWASDNLARLLCSAAVAKLPHRKITVKTPVGIGEGVELATNVMGVPIYRAGQALVQAFLGVVPQAAVGSLLIQRNEETAQPKLFYKKFPHPLPPNAIILDPMLATAGSAIMAVNILKEHGYASDSIYFLGVVASQEGFDRLSQHIPTAHITVAAVDPRLTAMKYIDPGLGDYGDRYFGT